MKKNKNKNIFTKEDLSYALENPIEKNGYRLVISYSLHLLLPKNKKDAEEFIKLYNKYLSGDIYCFTLYKIKKCKCCGSDISEMIESCGGFYDPDEMVDCINEVINHQK